MNTYIVNRMVYSAISMVGLIILVFFLARLTGNPAELYLPVDATPELRAAFSQVNGLDQPVLVQFWRFLVTLLHLDFGNSLRLERPALQLVLTAFPTTLILAFSAMALALVVAIVAGALAACAPNGILDRLVNVVSLSSASLPNFWLALVSILVFAVWLKWVPTSGTGTLAHWILPIMVLFARPCGLLAQVVRGSMIDALSSAYVKTARSKGVRSRSIIFVHALRNAMLPVITVAGDQMSGMINGAVVVEVIFGFPGIGKLMMDSIQYRDFAVIQCGVIITAAAIFLMNVLIDFAYVALNPRIRFK
ncbi:peptide/nickel transport system permease protein [Phyllobacterium trifolii]|uniref:Peptide/nickel transport system permease protein n=1 Tax=Phyllobacterium trifolii TaxID=300193 RepID=A0A839UKU9_9HYPH|nr:ABC transporter permease [Phyllobacterium trifolii]MBB3149500.1 peptide/nickel transport system permease protein [Phyllobacterium trifolii]